MSSNKLNRITRKIPGPILNPLEKVKIENTDEELKKNRNEIWNSIYEFENTKHNINIESDQKYIVLVNKSNELDKITQICQDWLMLKYSNNDRIKRVVCDGIKEYSSGNVAVFNVPKFI